MGRREVQRIRKQKRISFHCPSCRRFDLIDIRAKMKVSRKVMYSLRCPHCNHTFIKIGRRYNYWRPVKKELHLTRTQLRTLQSKWFRTYLCDGSVHATEIVREWLCRQRLRRYKAGQ